MTCKLARAARPATVMALLLATAAAQAATGTAASLSVTATAIAGGKSGTDPSVDQWGTLYAGLRGSAYVSVQDGDQQPPDPDGVTSASTSGYATADWDSSDNNHGVVVFSLGWAIDPRDRPASGTLGAGGSPAFSYSFIAGSGEALSLDYTRGGSGAIGWTVGISGGPEGARSFDASGTAGSWTAGLTGGASYTFTLKSTNPTLSGTDSQDINFYWDIHAAAVPEPASLGLMALGLGAVGLRLRRRRD